MMMAVMYAGGRFSRGRFEQGLSRLISPIGKWRWKKSLQLNWNRYYLARKKVSTAIVM